RTVLHFAGGLNTKPPSPCLVQQRSLLRDTILCKHLFCHIRYDRKKKIYFLCIAQILSVSTGTPLPTKSFFTPSHGGTFYRWLQHKTSIPLLFRSATLFLKGHIPLQASVW
ncbi:unnamed protein product, partial [Ectocarpus sp. 13 AM-2016]